MKYDDLEKTKELFEIDEDVPTPIDNIEMEGISKDTVTDEFTLGLSETESDIIKDKNTKGNNKKQEKKNKKEHSSLKEKWNNLSKKQKIIIISILCLVLIIIVVTILLLVLKKDDKKPIDNEKEPDKPTIVVEKENYTYKDGNLILMDANDNELGTYECKNKDEKLCFVAYFSNEDEFDTSKNVYEDESQLERRSPIFNNNYVFISDNNSESKPSIILYDITLQKELGTYSLIKGFSDSNYIILKDNTDKYGALEITAEGPKEKMKFTYDYLGIISSDSKVVAKTNNKYFIYNREGKLESKALAYPIKNYNNSYIVISNNGEYLYDYKSNLAIDGSYDYISLLDNYVALVSDSKLYIRDYKGNKYNEEGIELFNEYYNELKIYSKDNVLKSTKASFRINIIEDNIEVTYINKNDKEKTTNISINEGKVSSNYPNLNYFNGKLYIYKEENKKTLLGTYTCTNKNNINKDTTNLNNCIIASENTENGGWVPIINERFAFITDFLDQNNKTIMLYDLKNNKTLSRYANISTGLNTTDEKITFVTNNNLYITAENKSNKYGVIKIEDEAKSVIPFNYSNIEKLKNNYLATENNNSYILFDNTGTKIASSSKKIVDFNNEYLKTFDDNKYYISNYEKEIDSTGYLHITLEDDYYVVVDASTKKLDIKKYDDPDFRLYTQIDLGTEDYANAYKVGKNSSGYVITVTKTGEAIQVGNDGKTDTERTSSGIEN